MQPVTQGAADRCLGPSSATCYTAGARRVPALGGELAAARHGHISSMRPRHITDLFRLFLPGVQTVGVHGPAERPDGARN
jgi:hypothetical protein